MQIARLEMYEGEEKSEGKGKEEEGEEKSPELRKNLDSGKNKINNQEEGDNNEDGNNDENILAELGEYDEDYYVSMDDIYPQETDFVTVNNMITDESYQQSITNKNIKINSYDGYKDDCYISESIGGMNPMSKNPMEKKQIKKSESLQKIEKKDSKEKKVDIHESKQIDTKNFIENSSSSVPLHQSSKSNIQNIQNDLLVDLKIKNYENGSDVIVSKDNNSVDGIILESGSRVPNSMDNIFSDPLTASIDIGGKTENINENKSENKSENVNSVDSNKNNEIKKTDNDELDELERYLLNLNG